MKIRQTQFRKLGKRAFDHGACLQSDRSGRNRFSIRSVYAQYHKMKYGDRPMARFKNLDEVAEHLDYLEKTFG